MKRFMLLTFLVVFSTVIVDGKKLKGFTVDLIHRDSLHSPLFNDTPTLKDRAISRLKNYYSQSSFQALVLPSTSEYVMKYYIGTPPLEQYAIIDSASSLVWLQCHPCANCYMQGSPTFYPFHSSTYRKIPCSTEACHVFNQTTCGGPAKDQCLYDLTYADNSFTRGEMATDTLTFDSDTSQVEFPNIIIGCGYNNSAIVTTVLSSGVIGLSRGPSSLNSQLRNILPEKFSYCFVPPEISGSNSKLRFGEDDVFTSRTTSASTALLSHNGDQFYYLRLEGITVGNNRINNYDSGTTLTILQPRLYADLEAAVRRMISLNSVYSDIYRLCYSTESFRRRVGDIRMIFHFTGGADVTLGKTNIFIDGADLGLTCFAVIPSPNTYSIFGNRAQVNFNVQYDVPNSRISFAPADCTTFS